MHVKQELLVNLSTLMDFGRVSSCNHLMSIKQEKKPVNRFLQDGASAGIRSLQIIIEKKLCQTKSMERTLERKKIMQQYSGKDSWPYNTLYISFLEEFHVATT